VGEFLDVLAVGGDAIDPTRVPRDERDVVQVARFDEQVGLFCHVPALARGAEKGTQSGPTWAGP